MFAERSAARDRAAGGGTTNRVDLRRFAVAGGIALSAAGGWSLVYLVVEGAEGVEPAFLVSQPAGMTSTNGGALHAIIGTLDDDRTRRSSSRCRSGSAVALYVVEYRAGRRRIAVRTAVDLVAGIPSIVIGLFVYSLVVVTMGHYSGFAGRSLLR